LKKSTISKVLVILFLVSLLAACGSNQGATTNTETEKTEKNTTAASTEPAKKIYIPIIAKGFMHQFWQAVKLGAEKAAKEFNVDITFEGPDTDTQIDKQVEMLQVAIDKKASAIGFAALDSQAVIPLLKEAQKKNIPIIAFDSGVDSDIPLATATTDNLKAAAVAADKMAEFIGNEGEVAVISFSQTALNAKQRRDGFVDQIKAKYPNIKIVDIQYGGGDHLQSTDLAKTIMQAHPNLKGFFGTNEGSAIGILNAVAELKKEGKITIVGYDSGKQQMSAIRSGTMAGAITQNPIGIGYETVKAALAAAKGEKVEKTIDTGFYWYDKTNIDDEKIKAVLYE
jgi:ribose transport system substrate-binding protein